MEWFLIFASVFLGITCVLFVYLLFRLRRIFDRLESILGKIDENTGPIFTEFLSALKATRVFAERMDSVREDFGQFGRSVSKFSELIDLFLPDPKALKALKDGITTFLLSIFYWLFPKKEAPSGSKKDGEDK